MVEVVIPSTITVHLGRPKEDAENVTIPFIDYIKKKDHREVWYYPIVEICQANLSHHLSKLCLL